MSKLKLHDFVGDYQKIRAFYSSEDAQEIVTDSLIGTYYTHIAEECYNWLKGEENA